MVAPGIILFLVLSAILGQVVVHLGIGAGFAITTAIVVGVTLLTPDRK